MKRSGNVIHHRRAPQLIFMDFISTAERNGSQWPLAADIMPRSLHTAIKQRKLLVAAAVVVVLVCHSNQKNAIGKQWKQSICANNDAA